MKKINNKGFALVETLIVSAFVVGIFSVMYANFYPMMGEYEKRENYDDISSIYNANLIKRLIENYKNEASLKSKINYIKNGEYETIDEYDFPEEPTNIQDYYNFLINNLDVDAIYLTQYNITNFKNLAKNNSSFDVQTKEYIDYLPNYKNNSNNLACRIIVKYRADANKESYYKSGEFKYATIGVDCQ